MISSFSVKSLIPPSLLLITCLILFTSVAWSKSNRSVPELTGFAFFKFAKVDPDFRSWITLSDEYRAATPRDRVGMIRNGVPNLQRDFDHHVINDNPIAINTDIKITFPKPTDYKAMKAKGGPITVGLKLTSENGGFFSIPVADMWIALIPEDFDEMLTLEFTDEDYQIFKKNMSNAGISTKEATTTLRLGLIPTQADTTEPLVVDNFELWMLMAKIVTFEIWSPDNKTMLWYKDIEGYRPPVDGESVYNLFKN
ncbi:MAG: hypothetical protein NDJ24_08290 [Alphaproteobacteria bacterium]|nr:hypothetical protein [Alphaproteobacteria bacterium]